MRLCYKYNIENVSLLKSESSTAKLPNCQYNKAALKLEASVTNAELTILFHQLKTMRRYC